MSTRSLALGTRNVTAQTINVEQAVSTSGAGTATLTAGDDVVFTADWNPDIPADMIEQIKAKEAEIEAGDFVVFKGPLTDQSGTERVADGVAMTDGEIIGMDWHVAGVTTPLPS